MLRYVRKFAKDRQGVAAIEFAFIAPLLVSLLLGSVEVSNALQCRQKVTALASSAADLVAQTASVTPGDLTNIFNAVTAIVYPFPQGNTTIIISSVMSDGHGNGTVAWSQAQNGTARGTNTAVTLTSPIMSTCNTADQSSCTPCPQNTCSVIMAEVTYNYIPPFGRYFLSSTPLQDVFYARPRKSVSVSCTGCSG